MDKNVKLALIILGITGGISLFTFVQQRYYWHILAQTGEMLDNARRELQQRYDDLVFAGIIEEHFPDEDDTESTD